MFFRLVLRIYLRHDQKGQGMYFLFHIYFIAHVLICNLFLKSLLRKQIFTSHKNKVSSLNFWQFLWCLHYLFSDLV